MLEAAEMNFWRRAIGRLKIKRVTNESIGEIVQVTRTTVSEISRQLIQYTTCATNVRNWIPKQFTNCKPLGRRKVEDQEEVGQKPQTRKRRKGTWEMIHGETGQN